MHFCFEYLVAKLALEHCVFLLFVSQQVVLKRRCSPKFSRTLVAGKKLLFFVSVDVLQQVKLPVEALVTHFTYKQFFWLLGLCFLHVLAVEILGFCGGRLLCDI